MFGMSKGGSVFNPFGKVADLLVTPLSTDPHLTVLVVEP